MPSNDVTGPGEELNGPTVETGYAWIGTQLRKVRYTVVDGLAVVEGCIILGPIEKLRTDSALAEAAIDRGVDSLGVIIAGPQFRWPNKTVPFEIRSDLPQPERVTAAIAHWRAKASLKFVERTTDNAHLYLDYVTFRPGGGCSSSVGCQGGQQFVTLGGECTAGNAIHEIGHTVGLWHEQSRKDREGHITIVWEKISANYRQNFDQHITDGIDVGGYDFGSIMHYPRKAFSIDGSDTVIPKTAGVQIGQRVALSAGDLAAVAAMYP